MLAAHVHEHDVTNAEFIRTYMSEAFFGSQLLRRLEAEEKGENVMELHKRLPVRKGAVEQADILMKFFPETYGLRGEDARVHYLSPWEFVMYWEVIRLQEPPTSEQESVQCLTTWVPEGTFGAILRRTARHSTRCERICEAFRTAATIFLTLAVQWMKHWPSSATNG